MFELITKHKFLCRLRKWPNQRVQDYYIDIVIDWHLAFVGVTKRMHEKMFIKNKKEFIKSLLFSFLDISYNKEDFDNKKGIFYFTLKRRLILKIFL